MFYNGVTQDEINAAGSTVNGTPEWVRRGIVGRGVLLDYHSWRQMHAPEIKCDAFEPHVVKAEHLMEVAKHRTWSFRQVISCSFVLDSRRHGPH